MLTTFDLDKHVYDALSAGASRVLSKLGPRDRTQAVVMAYESGLIVPRSTR